ncbi:MAG TPA: hypothetical protein VMT00_10145 [Thermoanaerobaculia bacterium]|nr:hypothetical protein [Thermoanaerobaculia bacterium]
MRPTPPLGGSDKGERNERFGRALWASALAMLLTATLGAQESPAERVFEDAKVIARVIEVGGKDTPRDLLEKILAEDIELLRGRRDDGTYQHAHHAQQEGGRRKEGLGVAGEGRISRQQITGAFVYRLMIESPSRRYLVRRNRRTFIERVELELTPIEGPIRNETIEVASWIEPGSRRTFDFDEVVRKARATVYARTDERGGSASLEIILLEARVVDNTDSPWYLAVQNAKLLEQSLKKGDLANARTTANMVMSSLRDHLPHQAPAASAVEPPGIAETPEPMSGGRLEPTPQIEIYFELQQIQDLLTGTESERREGMDKLHQLVRRLRPLR